MPKGIPVCGAILVIGIGQGDQIGSYLEMMGGKAVAQGMYAAPFFDTRQLTSPVVGFLNWASRAVVAGLFSGVSAPARKGPILTGLNVHAQNGLIARRASGL